jgi:hypothetical protein
MSVNIVYTGYVMWFFSVDIVCTGYVMWFVSVDIVYTRCVISWYYIIYTHKGCNNRCNYYSSVEEIPTSGSRGPVAVFMKLSRPFVVICLGKLPLNRHTRIPRGVSYRNLISEWPMLSRSCSYISWIQIFSFHRTCRYILSILCDKGMILSMETNLCVALRLCDCSRLESSVSHIQKHLRHDLLENPSRVEKYVVTVREGEVALWATSFYS